MTPRCGRPMTRYERRGGPASVDDPECGRPEGHNGKCRSAAAVARANAAAVKRQRAMVRPCGCGCGEYALWDHRYRRGHNPIDQNGQWREAERSDAA